MNTLPVLFGKQYVDTYKSFIKDRVLTDPLNTDMFILVDDLRQTEKPLTKQERQKGLRSPHALLGSHVADEIEYEPYFKGMNV